MPKCFNCTVTASFRCGGCAPHRHPNHLAWYCSHICQIAHWQTHKTLCKASIIYSRVRSMTIKTTTDKEQLAIIMAEEQLSPDEEINRLMSDQLTSYLKDTKVGARPTYLVDDARAVIGRGYHDGIAILEASSTKEVYDANWAVTTPQDMHNNVDTAHEWQIPFEHRPLKWGIPDGKMEEVAEIEIYPQDFDVLPFEDYQRLFGGGGKVRVDPWAEVSVSEDWLRERAFAAQKSGVPA